MAGTSPAEPAPITTAAPRPGPVGASVSGSIPARPRFDPGIARPASGVAACNTLVPALFGGLPLVPPLSSPSPSGGPAPVTGSAGPLTCTPG